METWKPGGPIPIYLNMTDEVGFEKVIKRFNKNIGSNLKHKDLGTSNVHLFIDCFDEKAKVSSLASDREVNNRQTIYKDYLRKFGHQKEKNIKILVNCRTDYIRKDGQYDLRYFEVNGAELRVRFIAPIGFEENSSLSSSFNQLGKLDL